MDRLLAAMGLSRRCSSRILLPHGACQERVCCWLFQRLVASGLLSTAEKIYGSLGLRSTDYERLWWPMFCGAPEDPSA